MLLSTAQIRPLFFADTPVHCSNMLLMLQHEQFADAPTCCQNDFSLSMLQHVARTTALYRCFNMLPERLLFIDVPD
jgi:hypothetical protein